MVTFGNSRFATDRGVMVVATGDSAQFEKDEWMRKIAKPNPKVTTATQPALAILDLQVEI